MRRFFFAMLISTYSIELVRSFQIVMLAESSRFLGIDSPEYCTSYSLPKLVVQSFDSDVGGAVPSTLISRNVYAVCSDAYTSDEGGRVSHNVIGGMFSGSTFRFLDSFRYKDYKKDISYWNVFVELFPNESVSSELSTMEGSSATPQGYAEGALMRGMS